MDKVVCQECSTVVPDEQALWTRVHRTGRDGNVCKACLAKNRVTVSLATDVVQKPYPDDPGTYPVPVFWVVVASVRGHRWNHFKTYESQEAAKRLENRIAEHIRSNPEWTPEHSEDSLWHKAQNVYGSEAWSSEDEHELQKLDVENEFGPGSYRPGNPGYLGEPQ